MAEGKVKNRGWVKNVAIAFLAVMLVLTFFSNTIMNRTLPEVATAYVQSGNINTMIRGTGTIEAAETYEVKSADSRKVQSVSVRVGQTVAVDDVLVILGTGDSAEIDGLRAEIEDLKFSYQQKLVGVSSNSSSAQIERAREKLADLLAKVETLKVNPADIATAKSELDAAKAALDAGTVGSVKLSEVEAAAEQANVLKTQLDTLTETYKNESAALTIIATQKKGQAVAPASEAPVEAWTALMAKRYGAEVPDEVLEGLTVADIPADEDSADGRIKYLPNEEVEIDYVTYKKVALSAAYVLLENAKADYEAAKLKFEDLDLRFKAENGGLLLKVEAAQKKYDALIEKNTAYNTAKDDALAAQVALEQLVTASQVENLELARMRHQMAEKQAKLAKLLQNSSQGGEIKSDVAGVVKAINVTAGNMTDPSTPMMTIEVPDRGYTVSMSVTIEQAKKVTIGSEAQISTGYWGSTDMKAKLVAITPDKENPVANKKLVFEVTGSSVESGSQVSISIGEKTRQFEFLVPNASVRSDSNGSFVLIVESKNSPLGNRYYARRADVQILAKDDTNTAVQGGGITNYSYVITTSTKPVEPGALVRMAG